MRISSKVTTVVSVFLAGACGVEIAPRTGSNEAQMMGAELSEDASVLSSSVDSKVVWSPARQRQQNTRAASSNDRKSIPIAGESAFAQSPPRSRSNSTDGQVFRPLQLTIEDRTPAKSGLAAVFLHWAGRATTNLGCRSQLGEERRWNVSDISSSKAGGSLRDQHNGDDTNNSAARGSVPEQIRRQYKPPHSSFVQMRGDDIQHAGASIELHRCDNDYGRRDSSCMASDSPYVPRETYGTFPMACRKPNNSGMFDPDDQVDCDDYEAHDHYPKTRRTTYSLSSSPLLCCLKSWSMGRTTPGKPRLLKVHIGVYESDHQDWIDQLDDLSSSDKSQEQLSCYLTPPKPEDVIKMKENMIKHIATQRQHKYGFGIRMYSRSEAEAIQANQRWEKIDKAWEKAIENAALSIWINPSRQPAPWPLTAEGKVDHRLLRQVVL